MPVFQNVDDSDTLKQQLEATSEAVERSLIEAGEAYDAVSRLIAATEYSPDALEASETRLFSLRAAARKYDVDVSQLSSVRTRMRLQLDEIEHSDEALAHAFRTEKEAAQNYTQSAHILTHKRTIAAAKLAQKVAKELKPLKLERAKFRVQLEALAPETAGPGGCDKIAFEVETNPGAGFGPLHKIASGGEVARFALALRVCLAGAGDAGVGDAVNAVCGDAGVAVDAKRTERVGLCEQEADLTDAALGVVAVATFVEQTAIGAGASGEATARSGHVRPGFGGAVGCRFSGRGRITVGEGVTCTGSVEGLRVALLRLCVGGEEASAHKGSCGENADAQHGISR